MTRLLALLTALAALLAGPVAAQTSDWRTLDPEDVLAIETTKGTVLVELAPFAAPGHVARVKELARQGFYDGHLFHRVIGDFMAQTGDPVGDGTGGSPLPDLAAEFMFKRGPDRLMTQLATVEGEANGFLGSLPVQGQPDGAMLVMADRKVRTWGVYCQGVAAMARGGEENSANSQFFLTRERYRSLDRKYTIWGRVVSGLDVVRALAVGEPPRNPDRMVRVRVLADVPPAERPTVQVMDTRGPAFQALVARTRTAEGAGFDVCDVDLPAKVTPAKG
ncbi:MAG TPA: peptidylprolyl isomerase [Caulobacteraceae bacterium]|jgi:peptidylprolyl isomerase